LILDEVTKVRKLLKSYTVFVSRCTW